MKRRWVCLPRHDDGGVLHVRRRDSRQQVIPPDRLHSLGQIEEMAEATRPHLVVDAVATPDVCGEKIERVAGRAELLNERMPTLSLCHCRVARAIFAEPAPDIASRMRSRQQSDDDRERADNSP